MCRWCNLLLPPFVGIESVRQHLYDMALVFSMRAGFHGKHGYFLVFLISNIIYKELKIVNQALIKLMFTYIVVTLISRKVSVLLGTYILYSLFNHICYWVDHTGDPIDPSVLLKKKKKRQSLWVFFSFAVEAKCTCFAVSFIIFPNGNRLLYSYIYIYKTKLSFSERKNEENSSKEYIQ